MWLVKEEEWSGDDYWDRDSRNLSFGSNPYHRPSASTAAQAIRFVVNVAAHCPDGETVITPPAPRTRSAMCCRDNWEESVTDLPANGERNLETQDRDNHAL